MGGGGRKRGRQKPRQYKGLRRRGAPRAALAPGLETVWGKAFFRQLALALQRQFERVGKIRFGLFDGFALRNRGRNLLDEAGIAALFGGFKNGCQFHASILSHSPISLAPAAPCFPKTISVLSLSLFPFL